MRSLVFNENKRPVGWWGIVRRHGSISDYMYVCHSCESVGARTAGAIQNKTLKNQIPLPGVWSRRAVVSELSVNYC